MTADRFIAADGSVRWCIYGDGLAAIISDDMYQGLQRDADKIREAARLKERGQPFYDGEIGVWNGVKLLKSSQPCRLAMLNGRIVTHKTWREAPPYPTTTPWRHTSGQAMGTATITTYPGEPPCQTAT